MSITNLPNLNSITNLASAVTDINQFGLSNTDLNAKLGTLRIKEISADYTLGSAPSDTNLDLLICDTSSNAITVDLLPGADNREGKSLTVWCLSASYDVTVDRNGNTINGGTSNQTISGANTYKEFIFRSGTAYLMK